MEKQKDYGLTLIACYLGFVTQAIAANFAPLLFTTFKDRYGLSLDQIALIPLVFFMTQLITDYAAASFVDKIGYRKCVVASQLLSAFGLMALALFIDLFGSPFIGILCAVVMYAVGSGLIEVLISPIVEACPFENKEGTMSLLHSFYCWGSVAVIFGSTLFFMAFGLKHWKILSFLWALIPLYNAFNFISCPIEHLVDEDESMSIVALLKMPLFWLLQLLMVCSGSSEIAMSQWASAFTELALGVNKTVGDLAGPCLFAVLMGISRAYYGNHSQKLDLQKTMIGCGLLCVACYLLASLTKSPVPGLLGCCLCGVSVGIMWPGTISVSSRKIPKGGTAMFALLALGGDLGGSLGPTIVGTISNAFGGDLKIGLLCSAIFPLLLVVGLIVLNKTERGDDETR